MTVKPRGLKFVKRVYPARALGLGLGALAIGAALWPMYPLPIIWVILFYNGLIWPHLAYLIASRSPDPYQMERIQLLGDTVCGGFWVAAIGFNPLVSALVTMMLWMNNIASGGLKLFAKGLANWFFGLSLGLLVTGVQWNPQVSPAIVYASLPMLIAYPILIGFLAYSLAMDMHRQKQQMQQLSRIDGLTGLFNRSYWELRAKEEIAKARRNYTPLCLILMDIDHFKLVNDTYGHTMGDQVLRQLAKLLNSNLRESELLGRYGGEEFAIVLPNATKGEALNTAERLRTIIANAEFYDSDNPMHEPLHCTISLGVAAFMDGLGDFSSWLRAADKALYLAKHMGRNKSAVYHDTRLSQTVED